MVIINHIFLIGESSEVSRHRENLETCTCAKLQQDKTTHSHHYTALREPPVHIQVQSVRTWVACVCVCAYLHASSGGSLMIHSKSLRFKESSRKKGQQEAHGEGPGAGGGGLS